MILAFSSSRPALPLRPLTRINASVSARPQRGAFAARGLRALASRLAFSSSSLAQFQADLRTVSGCFALLFAPALAWFCLLGLVMGSVGSPPSVVNAIVFTVSAAAWAGLPVYGALRLLATALMRL